MIYCRCSLISDLLNMLWIGQKSPNKYTGIWYHPVLSIFKSSLNFTYSQKSRIWYKNFYFLFWLFSRQENLLFMEWFYIVSFLCRCRWWSRISTFSYIICPFHCSNFSYLWKKNKKSKYSGFFSFFCIWWTVYFSREIIY